MDSLHWLQLLQLSDSALPIGVAAHSFGLETLTDSHELTVDRLSAFWRSYLSEAGLLDVVYCRAAYRLLTEKSFRESWLELNARLDALKMARESRAASATLGRRFLTLAADLTGNDQLKMAIQSARDAEIGIHHCAAFGLVGGVLALGEEITALAYLQQTLTGLISVCQRLLPLGQNAAAQMLWKLKPTLLDVLQQSEEYTIETVMAFTLNLEVASMRHPDLTTRLFIS